MQSLRICIVKLPTEVKYHVLCSTQRQCVRWVAYTDVSIFKYNMLEYIEILRVQNLDSIFATLLYNIGNKY